MKLLRLLPDHMRPEIPVGPFAIALMTKALRQIKNWNQSLAPLLRVAVNVSAVQLNSDDFICRMAEILEQTGAQPQNIEIEITETVLMQNIASTVEKLRQI